MKHDEIRIEVHGGEVCMDVVAMLKAMGFEDTPTNRDVVCRHFVTELRRRSPNMRIIAVQGGGRQN